MPTLQITPAELIHTMEKLKADCRRMANDAKAQWGDINVPVEYGANPFVKVPGLNYSIT